MAYLARSLVNFRSEINRKWPRRDKSSDGWLGDSAHAARASDHNPDSKGCVHAIDIDKDGINPSAVVAAAIKHPATNYVIYNGVIYSRAYGFRARRYTGENPHRSHIHVSILRTRAAETSSARWLPATSTTNSVVVARLVKGKKNSDVKRFQTALRKYLSANGQNVSKLNPSGATGYYGYETVRLVDTAHRVLAKKTGNTGWNRLADWKASSALVRRVGLVPR